MYLTGARGQQARDLAYRSDGTIATGGTTQLMMPIPASMSSLIIQNISAGDLWVEFGSARGFATISNGVVTGVTITNGGFGFLFLPNIEFLGGGAASTSSFMKTGAGAPGYAAPNSPGSTINRPAKAHAVLTGGVVTSVVIDDGGAGYAFAPYVTFTNEAHDAYGCADPNFGGTKSGFYLSPGGGQITINGTVSPTEQIAIWGATTGQAYTARWTL